ncbi:hypothetical protein Q5691_04645 [Microcoleus sp. w1-18aA5]|uniref:hypothetical protein n=1 Tax=unclassified Microcoleus TaxID=2642155 RepID=UPI002FD71DC7
MAIAPLFQQQIQAAQQQAREEGLEQGLEEGLERGLEQGLERGRQEQQRLILENFLRVRFGESSPKMTVFLSPISKLAAEFTVLLLAISMLTVDETGREAAVKLLAESVLQIRSPELGDILPTVVTNLLALPVAELTLLVEQLPQLSAEELRERLGKTPE